MAAIVYSVFTLAENPFTSPAIVNGSSLSISNAAIVGSRKRLFSYAIGDAV